MNNKAGKKKYIAVMILLFLLGGAIGFAAVMLIDKGYDFSHYEYGSPLNDR